MNKNDIEKIRRETEEWLDLYSQLFDIIEKLQERYNETHSEIDKKILAEWLEEKKAYDRLIEEFNVFTNPLKKRVGEYIDLSKKVDMKVESNEIYSNSQDALINKVYSKLKNEIIIDDTITDETKRESIYNLMELIENTDSDDYEIVEGSYLSKRIPKKYLKQYKYLQKLNQQFPESELGDIDSLSKELSSISLDGFEEVKLENENIPTEEILDEVKEDNSKKEKEEKKVNEKEDKLYDEIVEYLKDKEYASITLIQRRFKMGYKRATEYVNLLEKNGIVSPSNGRKPRKVLINKENNNTKVRLKVEDYNIGDDVFGSASNDDSELLDNSIKEVIACENLFSDEDKANRLNEALQKLGDSGETRFEVTKKVDPNENHIEVIRKGNTVRYRNYHHESVFSKIQGLTLYGLSKISSLSKKAIKGIRKNVLNRNKNNGVEEITNVEQPRNRMSLKKKIIIGCSAFALVAITVGSAFAFKGCSSNNKKEDSKKDSTGITIETLPKKTVTGGHKNDPSEKKTKSKITKKTKSKTRINPKGKKILFGKSIKITTGSPIYTNAYSATNKTNGMKPYYSYNSSNNIEGVVLKQHNNIVSFVSPDNGYTYEFRANGKVMNLTEQEAINKVNELEKQGYQKTAVAVKNVNASKGITGFYNIDSIGGKTR